MKLIKSFIILLSVIFFFFSCNSKKEKNTSIEGIWQSVGHGKILKIESGKYQLFDLTRSSCYILKSGSTKEIDSISYVQGVLRLHLGAQSFDYRKLEDLPFLCDHKADDPDHNSETRNKKLKPLLIASL